MRPARLLPFAFLCACTTAGTPATEDTTPPGGGATVMTTDATGPSHALAPEVAKAALGTDTVFKMKVRIDADGNLVKQSAYHRNEAAIPGPVLSLAEQRFPGAKVMHFETEAYAEHGVVYEVEVDDGGRTCEVAARADGTELYTECHVDASQLDAAAKATIDGIAPGGKILEVETKKGPEIPEEITVEVEHQGQQLYLRLAADGSLRQALRRIPAVVEIPLP
ncbi:MAG: hypothetical protein H6712_30245 [Myxococcales bacterium]|nr:hypothetical protein [Myxococcales bacterium]MCB9718169.1 hypothetical protein [Myxococcales bacterium]